MPQPEFLTVAKLGDIPIGEGRAFEYHDQMVAVFNDNGQYRAIDDMCPHMGASLAAGHFEDCIVTCPWHGWSFDTRDGAWCDNRRIHIDTYLVRIVGDEIQVAAVEKPPVSETDDRPKLKTTDEALRSTEKPSTTESGITDQAKEENE